MKKYSRVVCVLSIFMLGITQACSGTGGPALPSGTVTLIPPLYILVTAAPVNPTSGNDGGHSGLGLPGASSKSPTEQAPQSTTSNISTRFEQIVEEIREFPPTIFPINNCGGVADVKQEITQNYIHEVVDETKIKFGIEIPVLDWLKIVAEIENRYGISDKETTTYSTTLTVPAGQNIQYTVIRKQTWESGVAIVNSDGIETSAAYRILKNETFEVANSEQKSCP